MYANGVVKKHLVLTGDHIRGMNITSCLALKILPIKTKESINQPPRIPMEKVTDEILMTLVLVFLLVVDAVQVLLTIPTKGIMVNQRDLLLQKSNRELKSMLVGVKKISNLNKNQLVDLVLTNV